MMAGTRDSYGSRSASSARTAQLVWGQVAVRAASGSRRRTEVLHLDGRERHRAQSWPKSRSRISRTTTSSRAWRTDPASKRSSRRPSPVRAGRTGRRRHLPRPRQLQARERQPGPQGRRRAARPAGRASERAHPGDRHGRAPERRRVPVAAVATWTAVRRSCPAPMPRCSSSSRSPAGCTTSSRSRSHSRASSSRHGIGRHQHLPPRRRRRDDTPEQRRRRDVPLEEHGPGRFGGVRHGRGRPDAPAPPHHAAPPGGRATELGAALPAGRRYGRRPHPGGRGVDPLAGRDGEP